MDRTDILASAASGITCTLDALKKANVLTPAEYNLIWGVVWGVIVDAKAAENTLRESANLEPCDDKDDGA